MGSIVKSFLCDGVAHTSTIPNVNNIGHDHNLITAILLELQSLMDIVFDLDCIEGVGVIPSLTISYLDCDLSCTL